MKVGRRGCVPKVLYLPLLTIPSGHERVADSVHRWLKQAVPGIEGKKVELLSELHPKVGEWVTSAYLRWILASPKSYGWLYRNIAALPRKKRRSFRFPSRTLFLRKVQEILNAENPDLVIATHAFPSLLLSELKKRGLLSVPVVNVYTDFFVNRVWGREGIDLHFLPSFEERERLKAEGVAPSRLYVTGIPVDPLFYKARSRERNGKAPPTLLIAGGSTGMGLDFLNGEELQSFHGKIHFLCGRNEEVYNAISSLPDPRLIPHRYMDSREKMNLLYDEADAIVTKPGGATVSEALHKGLPLFLQTALPAQEEENLRFLDRNGLAFPLKRGLPILMQVMNALNGESVESWRKRREAYIDSLEWEKGLAVLLRFFH